MRSLTGFTLAVAMAAAGFAGMSDQVSAQEKMSHTHMGHVTEAWTDTPDGMGLLPTAVAEAETAVQHAGLAAQQPDNLEWMQTHARHILHAVDPSVEPTGPGLGYGVMEAAAGSAKHVNFAAESDDASDNVRLHAVHVATSAQNSVARANEIIAQGNKVLAATTADDAAGHVQQLVLLAEQLLVGADADGDGEITWQEGEGGLNAAAKHMGFMADGEGIS